MAPTIPEVLRSHLEGTYELRRELGAGGMGVVWLAVDRMLDREVAIKVLHAAAEEDVESRDRFLREARLAARLQHPGIVSLLTFGEVAGHRFYVMPYVEGETLASRLDRGPLSEAEARRIVAEIAEALAHVHAQGIVHRDVKPANILLERRSGRALLTDFGIARQGNATRLTATGLVVGTPTYLAPEQAFGDSTTVDARADTYALGLVAWEAVIGESPFGKGSPQELIARKISASPPAPRSRVPTISVSFSEAVARAFAVEASERWARIGDFAVALRERDDLDPDPPPMREIRHVGAYALLGSVIFGIVLTFIFDPDLSIPLLLRMTIPGAVGLMLGGLLGLALILSRKREFARAIPWREVIRAAMRAPKWWPYWWPSQWTVPDQSKSLPDWIYRPVRRLEIYSNVMVAPFLAIALMPLFYYSASPEELAAFQNMRIYPAVDWFTGLLPFVFFAGFFVALPGIRKARKEMLKMGLTERQVGRVLGARYDYLLWREPFMRVFREAADAAATPKTIEELVPATRALADQLRASGWELESVDAVLADAVSADAAWEREGRELAADRDPREAGRVRERLDRLRGSQPRSSEQDEMIALLEKQLSLNDRLAARADAVQARRERVRDACGLLYSQLRTMRAAGAATGNSSEITGRLKAIAREVSQLQDSAMETERLVSGARDPQRP